MQIESNDILVSETDVVPFNALPTDCGFTDFPLIATDPVMISPVETVDTLPLDSGSHADAGAGVDAPVDGGPAVDVTVVPTDPAVPVDPGVPVDPTGPVDPVIAVDPIVHPIMVVDPVFVIDPVIETLAPVADDAGGADPATGETATADAANPADSGAVDDNAKGMEIDGTFVRDAFHFSIFARGGMPVDVAEDGQPPIMVMALGGVSEHALFDGPTLLIEHGAIASFASEPVDKADTHFVHSDGLASHIDLV